jgi:hypothetical protein
MTDTYELPAIMALLTALEAAVFATDGDPAHQEVVTARNAVRAAVQGAIFAERERIAAIVQNEIARAEALMTLEEGGSPVFDREQTEAGICALRTVAAAIRAG